MILAAFAALSASVHAETVKATVNGMVCSFCAQGITAHFKKHPDVANVHVDLARKLVILDEKQGRSISDGDVREAITNSGYEVVKIERVSDSFEKVKGK